MNLALLSISRVIFHDVPVRNRLYPQRMPTLSETETIVDSLRIAHLKQKLIKVLQSRGAYAVQFLPVTPSVVPSAVRAFTDSPKSPQQFVDMSVALATALFAVQQGSVSPGLLCVLEGTIGDAQAVFVMKLEREAGARLELTEAEGTGKKTYAMQVIDNLVLTDGTRLFKTAMFLRTGPGDDDFESKACDEQSSASAHSPLARFWIEFLGCFPALEPRVATQKFYETTVAFINSAVTNPVDKSTFYEHLHSELKSNQSTLSPEAFIKRCVHSEYRTLFRDRLKDANLLGTFHKDTSDIAAKLRRMSLRTEGGVTITVPAEQSDVVEVKPRQIVIKDQLIGVDRV